MSVVPLLPDQLRRVCPDDTFSFETTADLEPLNTIIGQPRGTRAIAFGIKIPNEGYNIFVMGPTGSGRATALMRYLQELTADQKRPSDWVYVNNFTTPHQPRLIALHTGEGSRLRADMTQLIADLRHDLPQAFETDTYRVAIEQAREAFDTQRGQLLQQFHQKAAEQGFALVQTASGMGVAPIKDGRQLTPAEMQQLSVAETQQLQEKAGDLMEQLTTVQEQIYQLEMATRDQVRQIDHDVAAAATQHRFDVLGGQYEGHDDVRDYLNEVREDVLNQIHDFAPQLDSEETIDLRRYEVNVLVDNTNADGAPVIIENNPTYHNLFGRIEYEMEQGVVTTHFTNIRCGSLHKANGGYLIVEALDMLRQPEAWEAMKRALKSQEISVQPFATMDGTRVLAKSLSPQPVPLSLKLVLVGSIQVYYALFEADEDFRDLFKVRADFDALMPRDTDQIMEYARFIAARCDEEKLPHFDKTAVAKVVEFGSRLADHQKRLSTRFGAVTDLVREAGYWATENGRGVATSADVQMALSERIYRANRIEELLREQILEETVFIATSGSVVGQVNGLSVMDTGDYTFGQPTRITARTYMGDSGLVHIERETNMSGPIHEKGVLTLNGYLGGKYAQSQPLSLAASLTFEQEYSGIDGDSASSTELYALLSALANLPLKQGIAVTGSVNQRGDIQPIGGVNEKIEGFFSICQARGLTGEQGVMIPFANLPNLMLHEDVVAAVAAGTFNVWAVATIDEGIELLTGVAAGVGDENGRYPLGSVHERVIDHLRKMALDLKSFGDDEDDSAEDEEE